MPPEILLKILDFYARMAPRQEVYRHQNNTLITTINSTLNNIFVAQSSAKIISDAIAKAAEDRLQLPTSKITSVMQGSVKSPETSPVEPSAKKGGVAQKTDTQGK